MERFRLVLRSFNEGGWKATLKLPFPSHHLFSAKFCRTFEITSKDNVNLTFFSVKPLKPKKMSKKKSSETEIETLEFKQKKWCTR